MSINHSHWSWLEQEAVHLQSTDNFPPKLIYLQPQEWIFSVTMYERLISLNRRQLPEIEPRYLACAVCALPLSCNNWQESMWKNHSAWVLSWWRELSGQPLMEFWRHILGGCWVCDCGSSAPPVHIDCEGWLLFGCHSSVTEQWLHKPGILGSIPSSCWPFTSLYFASSHLKFL